MCLWCMIVVFDFGKKFRNFIYFNILSNILIIRFFTHILLVKILTLVILNPDIFCCENSVDPDQLAPE